MKSRWVLVWLASFPDSISASSLQAGLSVSEPANLRGFSCATVSRAYRQWCEKQKHWQLCCNWKTTTRYDSVINNSISERTAAVDPTPRSAPFRGNIGQRLTKAGQIAKNAAVLTNLNLCWHTDGAVKILHMQHEFMDSSCLVFLGWCLCRKWKYFIVVAQHMHIYLVYPSSNVCFQQDNHLSHNRQA